MWALNRIEFPALVPLSVSNVSRKSGMWRHGIVHPLSKKPRTLRFLPKIADCFSGSRLGVSAWFCFLLHTGLVGLAISYALSVRDRLSGMVTSFTETEKQMVSVERAVQYIEDIPSEVSPHGTVRDSILDWKRPTFLVLFHTRLAQALKKYQILDKSLKVKNFRHSKKILLWVFLDIQSISSTKHLF